MIIACSTLMVSCDNWLEVKPYDQISEGELLKSEEGYQKMLNGIYIDLNSTALYGQSLSVEMIEVMGGAYTIGSDNSVWRPLMATRTSSAVATITLSRARHWLCAPCFISTCCAFSVRFIPRTVIRRLYLIIISRPIRLNQSSPPKRWQRR